VLTPDVNLLLYAHRADHAGHAKYRAWWEQVASGPQPFGLSSLVAVAFVRIATSPKIYDQPTPLDVALAEVEAILARSTCRMLAPGPGHFAMIADLCRKTRATGKIVADAAHAAVAMEHGCEWVTRDGDFARFEAHGLRWRHLLL
jgi:hypothetical protein